ncbi:hypothetical protein Marme_2728 [Marinomonas mediterranea MMB-1]|uniref:Orc1-like AAA ATPase domain-containing protein n=2 Tax=Marinomonas mediterranea TaxID=119864 RepID=F2JYC7_MARM1|nr:hypothetical protein Marme_2728 [Marinomonas mediterranea MMB-1]
MFRTVTHLACFFDVSVDYLMEDVPLPLLNYAKAVQKGDEPFVGRDWELVQLQQLYNLNLSSQSAACIQGMQGVGKTALIKRFLDQLQHTNKHSVYVPIEPNDAFTRRFCRAILCISNDLDDASVRLVIKALANTSLLYFYLLDWVGVTLDSAERYALSHLSPSRLGELEALAMTLLVQKALESSVSAIAIDNLHAANSKQLHFIEEFIEISKKQRLFLILGLTDIGLFTYPPDWLKHAHTISLGALNDSACESLASFYTKPQSLPPSQLELLRQLSIKRSNGHPAILKALIESTQGDKVFPEPLYKTTIRTLLELTHVQVSLLKFIACAGMAVKVEVIDYFLSIKSVTGIKPVHDLVCLGILCPKSNCYVFRHLLIWEIVLSLVIDSDRKEWKTFSQRQKKERYKHLPK